MRPPSLSHLGAAARGITLTAVAALTLARGAQAASVDSAHRLWSPRAAAVSAPNRVQLAAATTFTKLDNPLDPNFTELLGIDDAGIISGFSGSGAPGNPSRGFTIAAPYTSFTAFNVPGAAQTRISGTIADGPLSFTSGSWSPTNTGHDAWYGFAQEAEAPVAYDLDVNDPLTDPMHADNRVTGVASGGFVSGYFVDPQNIAHGYVYSLTTAANGGAFLPLTLPGAVSIAARGIIQDPMNAAEFAVCGSYGSGNGTTSAFISIPVVAPVVREFSVPGSSDTEFLAINAAGVAVGFWTDTTGLKHGLVYDFGTNSYFTLDAPLGANGTVLTGINTAAEIVGYYVNAANHTHGVIVLGAVQ